MPFAGLFSLVFKFLQAKQPINWRRIFLLHAGFFIILLLISSLFFVGHISGEGYFKEHIKGLLAGFLFSSLYMWLFFVSAEGFFKRKKSAPLLFALKWLFVLLVFLFFPSAFKNNKVFLFGLSGALSFSVLYIYFKARRLS